MAGGCLGFLYESKPEHRRLLTVFTLAVCFYVATIFGSYYGSVAKIFVAYQVKHFDSLSILSADLALSERRYPTENIDALIVRRAVTSSPSIYR